MVKKVKAIPEGYHAVTPYLIVDGAAKAIEFYKKAFAATDVMQMPMGNGKIAHAEIRIGDSMIMLADEFPEMDAKGPKAYGGSPIAMCLYVEDSDAVFNKAVAAGAKVVKPMEDQFYGDRSGMVKDPFGYSWNIATHKEDLSMEEIEKRMKAAKGKCPTEA